MEDSGNFRMVSLMFVTGKIIEQILMKSMLKHTEDQEVIKIVSMSSARADYADQSGSVL